MGLAVVASRALDGLKAPPVQVEVHLADGLPCFTLVGLADTEVKEARERVRSALIHSGMGYPHNQRITVNLAPADLPKESGRFDLPIAVGILAAQGLLEPQAVQACEFAGELSLAGELRPVRGALAQALAFREHGAAARRSGGALPAPARSLVLPAGSAAEAALVEGVHILQAHTLAQVVQSLRPSRQDPQSLPRAKPMAAEADGAQHQPELADVRGQAAAKRALEVAAAGRHNLLLIGPPGSGKSMLAQRLPGLLPPMNEEEALASAALASISQGGFDPAKWRHRPLRAPHHSASAVALVGGGSPPRPGEISLAHGGVLFLDELPEFPRNGLEALREPLETGSITLSRAARQACYPAGFQLVAAMNPCPCGWLGSTAPGRLCRCTPDAVARYQARISGPLLDRIDLRVEVPTMAAGEMLDGSQGLASTCSASTDDSTAAVALRVLCAFKRAQARQGKPNQQLQPRELEAHCMLAADARAYLRRAADALGWSGRSLHRAIRVARTAADLAGSDRIEVPHIAEALQLRRGLGSGA